MTRRKFFILASFGVIGGMALLFWKKLTPLRIKNALKSRLYANTPDILKSTFNFPSRGKTISVETALNSRCSSDHDGDQLRFHWGLFDAGKKLSTEQIETIKNFARIPRFTNNRVEIKVDRNMLTFVFDNRVSDIQKDWLMVESGMQQQAAGLVCAALGVGMQINNLGKDGRSISDIEYGTLKIRLEPMKPSYGGAFWSDLPPASSTPWLKGNLADPSRDSNRPLLATLPKVTTQNLKSKSSTDKEISQLLWAARGRTPHLHNSKPWAMTIPTWAGKQNISSVYLISGNKVSKYINWENNRPTHSLAPLNTLDDQQINRIQHLFSPYQALIILCKNEDFGRALWEVGYQFLNLLLQAYSLDINYRGILLGDPQKAALSYQGLNHPVAVLAV